VIGFIGSGQMARALAHGFTSQAGISDSEICFTNPGNANAAAFLEAVPMATRYASAAEVVAAAQQVWIAVKPQVLGEAIRPLRGQFKASQHIVSVVAGVRLATLQELTGHSRLIRVSPNTPCLVGKGISVFACSTDVDEAEKIKIQAMLAACGSVWDVPERLIDPISGLASCGPAFVMSMIEALSDGAVRAGVPRAMANQLVLQLLNGSTALVEQTGLHPAQLREQVASPAGSTIEGLAALEENGVRAGLIHAVCRSAKRAAELGEQII